MPPEACLSAMLAAETGDIAGVRLIPEKLDLAGKCRAFGQMPGSIAVAF